MKVYDRLYIGGQWVEPLSAKGSIDVIDSATKGFNFPSITSSSGGSSPSGDSATFHLGNGAGMIRVVQSGRATISGYGSGLDHDGPLGCKGRYFTADYSDNIRILFHYTRRTAHLAIGNNIYRFTGPPKRGGGSLVPEGSCG